MSKKAGQLKIGVTGSAGSGKSLVCRRLKERGMATLDCDRIAREVVEPGEKGLARLVERFGPGLLDKTGRLDRKALRKILVDDERHRREIEAVLHPLILEKMCSRMEEVLYNGKKKAVAVEVPLLFETDLAHLFDVTIAVVAGKETLAQRICQRDHVSAAEAGKMLALQMPQEEKSRRADHVITNSGTLSQLFDSVDKLFDKLEKEFLTI